MLELPTQQENNEALPRRRESHAQLANELAASTDEQLVEQLSAAQIHDTGHAAVSLPASNAPVFAKLVPLTSRDMLPENRRSSANLFRLPTAYQYRIGTCGGSAWRELEAQALGSEWVLSGCNPSFPLLHHWRVLPIVKTGYDDRLNVGPWGGCAEIRQRLLQIREATSSLVLFIEHVPLTLTQWIQGQLSDDREPLVLVEQVERVLTELFAFIHDRGLLHLDAHFDNILTDGHQFYLTDFGLALSRRFQLDSNEELFFDLHANFDRCTVMTSLVHAIVTHYDPRDDWRQSLREMLDAKQATGSAMPAALHAYLDRKAPVPLMMGEFYQQLTRAQSTAYPAAELQTLLER